MKTFIFKSDYFHSDNFIAEHFANTEKYELKEDFIDKLSLVNFRFTFDALQSICYLSKAMHAVILCLFTITINKSLKKIMLWYIITRPQIFMLIR